MRIEVLALSLVSCGIEVAADTQQPDEIDDIGEPDTGTPVDLSDDLDLIDMSEWPEVNDDRCSGQCSIWPYSNCPLCPEGTRCTMASRCEPIGEPLGAYCGPTETCTSATPGWPDCMSARCDSRLCLSVNPNVFVMRDVCTQECVIYADDDGDGVNDADAPDDCGDAVDGPAGQGFRCVVSHANIGVCAPGSTFATCEREGDCRADEGCELTMIGGVIGYRCVARYRVGAGWSGVVVPPGAACGELGQHCATGLCAEPGCVTRCAVDADCASLGVDGPDGPWTCQPPRELFPAVMVGPLCWPAELGM